MNTFFAAQFIDRTDSTTLWTKNVISHLRNYEGSKAGLKDDNNVSENKTGSERIALQIGFHPNLGHYFWQEITGLQRILELYGTNSFDCILCGKYSRLRLDKLFPAIPSKKLITLDSSDSRELYEYTRNLSANIIRPVGCELNDYVRGNIYSYCQSELSSKKLCYINEVTSDFNFIWFNLRNHNKSWGGQVNGIIQIAKEMNKRYKNVGVLIDGFNDTESIASAIMEQIPNEIYVVNTIGCSFVESIVWANKVKTFCSVLGSGLVINSWLANGRGFSHGNVEHLKQARYWGSVNPSSEVYFLSPDNVVSNSGIYDNYDFDFNIALSCIDEIFHDLGVERK
jgi:hypothetical protein